MPGTPTAPADAGAPTHWERVAQETSWGRYISAVERRTILRGSEAATGPRSALEVGCDGGRWSALLADAGWSMTCTDIDVDALDACGRRVPSAERVLVTPDCTVLPAESNSLGLLLCFEVFWVVHERWFLEEVARVLAPGGVCVAVVSNRASHRRFLWQVANRPRSNVDTANPPMYSRSYRSWRHQLREHGFVPISEEGLCWMPFSRQSNARLVTPLNELERVLGLRRVPMLSPWICSVMQREPTLVPSAAD